MTNIAEIKLVNIDTGEELLKLDSLNIKSVDFSKPVHIGKPFDFKREITFTVSMEEIDQQALKEILVTSLLYQYIKGDLTYDQWMEEMEKIGKEIDQTK